MLIAAAVAVGLSRLFPRLLRTHMAPPQRPQPHTPADLGLPEVPITLRSPGDVDLHAWFIPAGDRAPAVIVLHGWGANASLMLPLAPHLHRSGFPALVLDARNHGRSEHDDFVSMPRFAEDLDVAIDWLHDHHDVSSVGVIGHSVGAGAALLSGSRRDDLDAIVSVSAFAHPGETMAQSQPMSRLPGPVRAGIFRTMENTIGYKFDEIAPRATITRVDSPVMLVHGDADQVVPIDALHELAGLQPDAETVIVPGAGHASLERFEPHVHRILGFLSSHLVEPEPEPTEADG